MCQFRKCTLLFECIVEFLQHKLEDADLDQMVVVARNLWLSRRNSVIFGGVRAWFIPQSFLCINLLNHLASSKRLMKNHIESKIYIYIYIQYQYIAEPIMNYAKVNQDAAVDKNSGKISIGVVVRDFKGEVRVLATSSAPGQHMIINPTIVEANADQKGTPSQGSCSICLQYNAGRYPMSRA